MTTLTIQAMDTASAMDQIAEQLGEDAFDSFHNKKDGKVFMRATNGADLPSPPNTSKVIFNYVQCRGI